MLIPHYSNDAWTEILTVVPPPVLESAMCVLAYERGAYTLAFLKAGFKMNNIPEAKWVLPMLQEVKCDKKHYHVVMEWLRKQPKGHRHLALGIDRLRLNDDKLSYETCVPA